MTRSLLDACKDYIWSVLYFTDDLYRINVHDNLFKAFNIKRDNRLDDILHNLDKYIKLPLNKSITKIELNIYASKLEIIIKEELLKGNY